MARSKPGDMAQLPGEAGNSPVKGAEIASEGRVAHWHGQDRLGTWTLLPRKHGPDWAIAPPECAMARLSGAIQTQWHGFLSTFPTLAMGSTGSPSEGG